MGTFAWSRAVLTARAACVAGQLQCAWYFVNYTLDTSVGVFIAWIMIHAVEELARQCHWKRLEKNGEYYGAPHVFLTWLLQFCVWLLIIAMAKACLLGLLVLAIHPLADFALWASSPFKDHPHTELVVVMVVCPFLMNATQFWIQDNFLKGRTVKMSHDADDDESSGGGGGGGGSRPDDQDDVEGKLVRNPALSGGAAGPLLVHADGTDAVRDYSGRFDGIVTSDHTEDDAKLAAHATTATGTSGSGRQSSGSGPLSSHSSGGSGGASGGSGHPLELGGHAEWEREGSTLSAMEVSSRHSDDFTGGGEFDSMLSTSARASSTSRLPPSVN